ncbi:MAG: hypothetical protein KGL99_06390 [Burkholderiales bacterium]|nr:hypothetical protein [Burkholderiales bacterium]
MNAKSTLALLILLAALVGCASRAANTQAAAASPVAHAPSPTIPPITVDTPFEGLRNLAEAKGQAAGWYVAGLVENGLPMMIAFTKSGDYKVLGKEGFQQWCSLKGGKIDATAVQAAKAVIRSKNESEYGWDVVGCAVGAQQFAYASAYWMGSIRQAWFDSVSTATGQGLTVRQKYQDEAKTKAAAAKYAEAEKQRLTFIQKSKPGTTVACEGYVLAQGMSKAITMATLTCGNIEARMEELIANGWQITMQTARPDGDFGGAARTRYDFMFRKS